jgi:hypothetical protein
MAFYPVAVYYNKTQHTNNTIMAPGMGIMIILITI